jgi:hypothetical protein
MAKVTRAKAKRARPKSRSKSKSRPKSKPKPKPKSKPKAKLKSASRSIRGQAAVRGGEFQEGSYQISGPGARERCVYWNGERLPIDFHRPFNSDPRVIAIGRATNPNDRVRVVVLTTYANRGFYCDVTTYGQQGHGICDPAFIDWKAYTPALSTGAKPPAAARRSPKR